MSKKRNFNKVVVENLSNTNSKSHSEQAVVEVKEFIDKDIPKEVEAYDWEGNSVLIEVFSFQPEDEFTLKTSTESGPGDTFYMQIAKVIACGGDSKYSVGDIVKLRDSDVTTVENPKYKAWVNNDYSKSNLKQKGTEPTRFGSNIVKTLGPFLFDINPFKIGSKMTELYFKVSDSKIENKIKDVSLLLDNI